MNPDCSYLVIINENYIFYIKKYFRLVHYGTVRDFSWKKIQFLNRNRFVMCSVITGENIDKYRLYAIRAALRLESIGLKGRFNAAKIAREILNKAGYKADREKRRLLVQYCDYLNSLEN